MYLSRRHHHILFLLFCLFFGLTVTYHLRLINAPCVSLFIPKPFFSCSRNLVFISSEDESLADMLSDGSSAAHSPCFLVTLTSKTYL